MKKVKKGSLAWEIEQRRRKDYLKAFAKDPYGKLQPGDKIAGPTELSTFLGKKKNNESVDESVKDKIAVAALASAVAIAGVTSKTASDVIDNAKAATEEVKKANTDKKNASVFSQLKKIKHTLDQVNSKEEEETVKLSGGQKAAYNMGKKHGQEGKKIDSKKSFGVHAQYYDLGHKHGTQDKDDSDSWHEKQQSGRRMMYHEGKLTFKEYLIESAVEHDLFVGRFQPFHKGHAAIVAEMKNPIIAIVKRKRSSEDKHNNPLTFEQQKFLINSVFPKAIVIEVANANLHGMLYHLKNEGKTIRSVFAGEDRIEGYRKSVERSNAETGKTTTVIQTPRITSATTVRETIRSNNFEDYKTMMPLELANEEIFKMLLSEMATQGE